MLLSHFQFSQYLHENASYVRPLEEGMLHLFESITEDTVTVLVIPSLFYSRKWELLLAGNAFNCEITFLSRRQL